MAEHGWCALVSSADSQRLGRQCILAPRGRLQELDLCAQLLSDGASFHPGWVSGSISGPMLPIGPSSPPLTAGR